MKRRHFMAGTAALPLVASTGGFASQALAQTAPTSPKPQKIVAIISSNFDKMLEVFGAEWTKKTGINVEIVSQSYDTTYTKIVAAIAGGSPVDVVIADSIWTSGFKSAGFIRSLDAMVRPFEKDLVPVAINQRKVDNQIYSMPITNEAKFLYFNEDILRKGGYAEPPKTWEELAEVSRDLQRKGHAKHGIVWGWRQAEGMVCDFVLLVHGHKGAFQDEKGAWTLNQGNVVKALEFMVDQLKSGIADPASTTLNDRQVVDVFAGGGIPFMLNWSFALSASNDPRSSKVAGHIKVGLIPGFKSTGVVSTSVTGGSGFAVTTTSKSPDWAWDMIQYATDRQRQLELQKIRSNMPVWRALYDDPTIKSSFPYVKDMERQFEYATWRPNLPNYTQFSGIIQVAIHKALLGEKTPQQALNDAAKEVAALR